MMTQKERTEKYRKSKNIKSRLVELTVDELEKLDQIKLQTGKTATTFVREAIKNYESDLLKNNTSD